MATKNCCCPGDCHQKVDVSDMAPDEQETAVVLCELCEAADCDPFSDIAECRAVEENEEPAEHANCPRDVCVGEGYLMGVLGRRAHYRCRACGTDFNEFLEL